MRCFALLTTSLSLLSVASARIFGIAAPSQVGVDTTVKLEILAQDFIQSVQDVAISFGIQSQQNAEPDSLGTLLSSKFLGPDDSNVVGNITHFVHIPSSTPHGPTVLTGSLFSLIGALLSPDISNFNVTVQVGRTTSSTYVSSD